MNLAEIPTVNGYIDADGPNGVDFEGMVETLDYIKQNGGHIPETYKSWQYDIYPDQRDKALRMVPEQVLDRLRDDVSQRLGETKDFRIVIIEGFLLYNMSAIRQRLDCKLFVRLDHAEAKHRRMTRSQYGSDAEEGEFWKTEDYFEKMVWWNYIEQHADLFVEGNVEGNVDLVKCSERGIAIQEAMNVHVEDTLIWAVDIVLSFLIKKTQLERVS